MLHNSRALEADWVPRDVVHRNPEKNALRDALEPLTSGEPPQDVLIDGPSGVGKTCLSRHTVQKLEEETIDVDTVHIDCWNHSRRFRVLLDLCEVIGPTHDIHRSTPKDEMLARVETHESDLVVILDEADQLADSTLIRELWSIPHVHLLCIANREADILAALDERIKSRFRGAMRVHFDSYSHDDLVAILNARVQAALAPHTIRDEQIETLAEAAGGNARDAITALKNAVYAARREGVETVCDHHIEEAMPEARREIHETHLNRLHEHQRLLYDILLETGPQSPKELRERYETRVDDAKSKRTVRTYLGKLDEYDLVEATGQGPSRIYEAVEIL
ncbi:AAA family ATPase [Halobacteriales archaeon SW_8_65_20]|nr:MAG: AAA family ATPase [Halobacteriales archaeon SW_8_65_20]